MVWEMPVGQVPPHLFDDCPFNICRMSQKMTACILGSWISDIGPDSPVARGWLFERKSVNGNPSKQDEATPVYRLFAQGVETRTQSRQRKVAPLDPLQVSTEIGNTAHGIKKFRLFDRL